MRSLKALFGFLVVINCSCAVLAAERDVYYIQWNIAEVAATNKEYRVGRDQAIVSTRFIPERLYQSSTPLLDNEGVNLVDAGEWFVHSLSKQLTACIPRILKKTAATNRVGGRQVCVVDTDGDGGFDSYFIKTVGALQTVFVPPNYHPNRIPAEVSRVNVGFGLIQKPAETDIGMPPIAIKYGGGKQFYWCVGSGMVGKQFGCLDSKVEWIEPDRRFSLEGAEFEIVQWLPDNHVIVRFSKNLPSTPLILLPSTCSMCSRP